MIVPLTGLTSKHTMVTQQPRERLFRAGGDEYVVTQNVDPQVPGDIPLGIGMPVEGTYMLMTKQSFRVNTHSTDLSREKAKVATPL